MFNRLLCTIAAFLFLAPPAFAVSVIVTDKPSTISTNPFSVTVSVYGANSGKNYLRVDLFKDGESNYFGETYNGSDWYSGSDGTSYFPIDIVSDDSTASATFQAQIGKPTVTEYSGPGTYKLRIRRYTSASSSSPSDSYDVAIDVPLPTATPAPTHTPTKTPTATSAPTSTKTPTPTVKQAMSSPTPVVSIGQESQETGIVLGATDMPQETPVSTVSGSSNMNPIIISLLFVGAGLGLLSGVFIWQKRNAMR